MLNNNTISKPNTQLLTFHSSIMSSSEQDSEKSLPSSMSSYEHMNIKDDQRELVHQILDYLRLKGIQRNELQKMFSYCFINGKETVLKKLFILIHKFQYVKKQIERFDIALSCGMIVDVFEHCMIVTKMRKQQIKIQDFQFVCSVAINCMEEDGLREKNQSRRNLLEVFIEKSFPIRRSACINLSKRQKMHYKETSKENSAQNLFTMNDLKNMVVDVFIENMEEKENRSVLFKNFKYVLSQENVKNLVEYRNLLHQRNNYKDELIFTDNIQKLAFIFKQRFEPFNIFLKRKAMSKRSDMKQQAEEFELNWKMRLLSRMLGQEKIQQKFIPRSYERYKEFIAKQFQVLENLMPSYMESTKIDPDSLIQVGDEEPENNHALLDNDKDSFDSCESYYEEADDVGLICMSEEEVQDKKYCKIHNSKSNYFQQLIMKDFMKLTIIMSVSKKMDQESDILYQNYISYFLNNIPCLKEFLKDFNRPVIKQIIDNCTIKIFKRGQVLFQKNEPVHSAYVILSGVVNKVSDKIETVVSENNFISDASLTDLLKMKEIRTPILSPKSRSRSSQFNKIDSSKTDSNFRRQNAKRFEKEVKIKDEVAENPKRGDQNFDFEALNPRQIQTLFNFKVDQSLDKVQSYFPKIQGSYQPGDLIGSLDENQQIKGKTKGFMFSALCKTDTLVLEINKQVFKALAEKKLEQRKQQIAQFLLKKFPMLYTYFSIYKIADTAYGMISELKFFVGKTIIHENEVNNNFYILRSGEVEILKKITYKDIHNGNITQTIRIIKVSEGEIIGENALLQAIEYEQRDKETEVVKEKSQCLYTARVVSREGVVVYSVNADMFASQYKPVMKEIKTLCLAKIDLVTEIEKKRTMLEHQNYIEAQRFKAESMSKHGNLYSSIEAVKVSFKNQELMEKNQYHNNSSAQSLAKAHQMKTNKKQRTMLVNSRDYINTEISKQNEKQQMRVSSVPMEVPVRFRMSDQANKSQLETQFSFRLNSSDRESSPSIGAGSTMNSKLMRKSSSVAQLITIFQTNNTNQSNETTVFAPVRTFKNSIRAVPDKTNQQVFGNITIREAEKGEMPIETESQKSQPEIENEAQNLMEKTIEDLSSKTETDAKATLNPYLQPVQTERAQEQPRDRLKSAGPRQIKKDPSFLTESLSHSKVDVISSHLRVDEASENMDGDNTLRSKKTLPLERWQKIKTKIVYLDYKVKKVLDTSGVEQRIKAIQNKVVVTEPSIGYGQSTIMLMSRDKNKSDHISKTVNSGMIMTTQGMSPKEKDDEEDLNQDYLYFQIMKQKQKQAILQKSRQNGLTLTKANKTSKAAKSNTTANFDKNSEEPDFKRKQVNPKHLFLQKGLDNRKRNLSFCNIVQKLKGKQNIDSLATQKLSQMQNLDQDPYQSVQPIAGQSLKLFKSIKPTQKDSRISHQRNLTESTEQFKIDSNFIGGQSPMNNERIRKTSIMKDTPGDKFSKLDEIIELSKYPQDTLRPHIPHAPLVYKSKNTNSLAALSTEFLQTQYGSRGQSQHNPVVRPKTQMKAGITSYQSYARPKKSQDASLFNSSKKQTYSHVILPRNSRIQASRALSQDFRQFQIQQSFLKQMNYQNQFNSEYSQFPQDTPFMTSFGIQGQSINQKTLQKPGYSSDLNQIKVKMDKIKIKNSQSQKKRKATIKRADGHHARLVSLDSMSDSFTKSSLIGHTQTNNQIKSAVSQVKIFDQMPASTTNKQKNINKNIIIDPQEAENREPPIGFKKQARTSQEKRKIQMEIVSSFNN